MRNNLGPVLTPNQLFWPPNHLFTPDHFTPFSIFDTAGDANSPKFFNSSRIKEPELQILTKIIWKLFFLLTLPYLPEPMANKLGGIENSSPENGGGDDGVDDEDGDGGDDEDSAQSDIIPLSPILLLAGTIQLL